METGFDCNKYIEEQKNGIKKQLSKFEKVYLELGGKPFDDYHASRILPGYSPDTQLQILSEFKKISEFIFCINSENIQNDRIRSDYNSLYIDDCLNLIDTYRKLGFKVSSIVFSLYKNQPEAVNAIKMLKDLGEKVYISRFAENYPFNIEGAIDAFEKSNYIKTTKPLVVVTSSGSASGKLGVTLGQIYKEQIKGRKVSYIKYDIFPVWNLPVNHPINLAYMAATVESNDKLVVDKYYNSKHKKICNNL